MVSQLVRALFSVTPAAVLAAGLPHVLRPSLTSLQRGRGSTSRPAPRAPARTAPGEGVGVLRFRSWEVSAPPHPVPNPSASVTGPWNPLLAKLLSPPALAPRWLLACVPPRPSPSSALAPAACPGSPDSSPPHGRRAVGPARGLQAHPQWTVSAAPTPELLVAPVL